MRIEFKRIEMRNFMAFAEEAFDFNACKGMSLVQGRNNDIPGAKNGCGKSQMFLSLLYVLFGQLQSKVKNENLVSKYTSDKDMDLVLSFSVDGIDYKVRRGLIKGKSSYLELSREENGVEVDMTKSTIPETQAFIEKELLHCDVSIFLRTILLTADQTYNFYMLKKADKKEFVEKLFDISIFEDMHRAMHKDVLSLEKDAVACQNRLMVLNKSLEDYSVRGEKHEESRRAKLKVINESIVSLEKRLQDAKKAETESNAAVVKKLEEKIEEIDHTIETTGKECDAVQAKLREV